MRKNQLTNAMKVVIASMVVMLQEGKSDEEIIEASKTDKIGDKDCTDEMLADLLAFAKDDSAKGSTQEVEEEKDFHGNKDTEQKYPKFPKSWAKSVIVRTSISQKIGPKDKDVVEVPSSVKFKCFDASLYDTHVKQGMFNKQNVEIVHDPR